MIETVMTMFVMCHPHFIELIFFNPFTPEKEHLQSVSLAG